jgi:large subunit ribosomal protein L3
MGNANLTAKNLKVVKVDNDENLLLVRGSVPGPSGAYIFIRRAKNAKKTGGSAAKRAPGAK